MLDSSSACANPSPSRGRPTSPGRPSCHHRRCRARNLAHRVRPRSDLGSQRLGMPLSAWLVVLAGCALTSLVVSISSLCVPYSVAFDFLSNMPARSGDKVASLPLGSFRADTAGKTSRLVSRELMVLGEIFAHMYSPLIAAIVTSACSSASPCFRRSSGWCAWSRSRSSAGVCWRAGACSQGRPERPPARELSPHVRIRDQAGRCGPTGAPPTSLLRARMRTGWRRGIRKPSARSQRQLAQVSS